MTEPTSSTQTITEQASSTVTCVETVEIDGQDHELPTLKLRLKKPKNDKKVQWTTETVDNEGLNKKKSKCCCIYDKPKKFGEDSDSDSDEDEVDHCKGHVEKRKHKHTEGCPLHAPTPTPTNTESDN